METLTKFILVFMCLAALIQGGVSMPPLHRPGNRGQGFGIRHRPGNGHHHGHSNPNHPSQGNSQNEQESRFEEDDSEDSMAEYIIVTKKDRMRSAAQQRAMANSCETFLDTAMHLGVQKRSAGRALPKVTKFSKFNIGFSAMMNRKAVEMVKELEDVDFVEKDQNVTVAAINLGYHLDRIDQKHLPLNGEYQPKYTGKGVDIYILDTGIRYTHEVFGGRASFGGYDHFGGNGEDCQSHGTHVAGLAGGNITGAAVGANLYSIRVLDCKSWGTYAGVIGGINHVINRVKNSGRRSVLSMSIEGPKSAALNVALKEAEEAGLVNVLAAGNSKADACLYSPASSPNGITVGGSNRNDGLYWFAQGSGTNHGKCVDIFAPGQYVNSASHLSNTGIVSKSGTSMATPIVSGVVAMLLEEDPSLTPEQVKEELIKRATKDVLDFNQLPQEGRKVTPNLLIFVEAKNGEEPTPTSTVTPIPSTTVSSVTLDTVTTETVTMTTEAVPMPTPTPDPIPTPEPLPSQPNLISPEISITDVALDVEGKQALGFVPSSVNSFMLKGIVHFSISYKFVGAEVATTRYAVQTDLPLKDLLSVSRMSGNWVPVAMAPYMKDEKTAAIFIVLKQNGGDFVIATSQTVEAFKQDVEEMKANNYYPVSFRYLTNEFEQTSVYALYRKWASTELVHDLKVSEFITRSYSLNAEKAFLQDVTFRIAKDGSILYSGVFQKDTTNSQIMYIDFRSNVQTTIAVYNVLRNAQYHAVTLTPVLSPQPNGFLVVYWR